jgi:Uma2 family endonuclease
MTVSEATYLQKALEEVDARWELVCGQLRQKPDMTADHNNVMGDLTFSLMRQLDRAQFRVRQNSGRVRRGAENYFIPDVFVVPRAEELLQRGTRGLEYYAVPLPLVVEVWSPSTGTYDIETKLVEYQRRGDLEIWRIHPYDRTLTAWVRQADGSYAETLYTGGQVRPTALPSVVIDLETRFE